MYIEFTIAVCETVPGLPGKYAAMLVNAQGLERPTLVALHRPIGYGDTPLTAAIALLQLGEAERQAKTERKAICDA